MLKRTAVLVAFLSVLYSPSLFADECMEGDCDNGYGTGFTLDNKVYEGEWKNGVPHGQGKKYLSRGNVIEGRWEKGKLVEEKTAGKEEAGKKKDE